MTMTAPKALLLAALLGAFAPLPGQDPVPSAKPADPKPAAKPVDPKPSAKPADPKPAAKPAAKATKKTPAKADPAAKAVLGIPNPNAPLVPKSATKVPVPRRQKPEKIPYEKRMNLNGASREELMTLPAVDGATADRIIAGRPYKMSAELLTRNIVPGAHFWTIKPKVTAGKFAGSPAKK